MCDTATCSGGQVKVTYASPTTDGNVLRIEADGNAGNDEISVLSTSTTVPVKADGGTGDDKITVGNAAHGVNDIVGISRPNLNQPDGVGPVAVVGGSGHDVLIVDDSGDTSHGTGVGDTGRITSFLQKRTARPRGRRDRHRRGLGMRCILERRRRARHDGPRRRPRRVRGRRGVDVRLSPATDTFAIGGDTGLLGTGSDALPQARQALILGFTNTPSAQ